MSPTPQTPPTDRPLTAGDVPLLREGDVLRCINPHSAEIHKLGTQYVFEELTGNKPGGGNDIRLQGSRLSTWSGIFAFVSRPATSAASEVAPFAEGGIGHAMQERGHAYLNDYVLSTDGADYEPNEFERSLLEDFMSGLLCDEAMFGPVRALLAQQAALASPPVSERERELEGALRNLLGAFDTPIARRRLPPTDFSCAAIDQARALTAQPAGEGL